MSGPGVFGPVRQHDRKPLRANGCRAPPDLHVNGLGIVAEPFRSTRSEEGTPQHGHAEQAVWISAPAERCREDSGLLGVVGEGAGTEAAHSVRLDRWELPLHR